MFKSSKESRGTNGGIDGKLLDCGRVLSNVSVTTYLQRYLRVQLEFRQLLWPRFELFCFLIDVVVKYGSLTGKFDRLELIAPPFAELQPMIGDLVAEQCTSKGPHGAEHKVQFVPLLWAIGRSVCRYEMAVKQIAEHLHMSNIHDWGDSFESQSNCLQTKGDVFLEQNRQVGLFRFVLTIRDPTWDEWGDAQVLCVRMNGCVCVCVCKIADNILICTVYNMQLSRT